MILTDWTYVLNVPHIRKNLIDIKSVTKLHLDGQKCSQQTKNNELTLFDINTHIELWYHIEGWH